MAPTLYDEKPEVGDLIEIFRGSYQHWAVYVGDGFIVHLAPPSLGASNKGIVKKEKLCKVVERHTLIINININLGDQPRRAHVIEKKEKLIVISDEWKINNSLDKQYQPRPADVIVRQACEMVGAELPYCIVTYNCEHFANELRYGKAESRQVVRTVVKASILATVFVVGGFLVGFFSAFVLVVGVIALLKSCVACSGSR